MNILSFTIPNKPCPLPEFFSRLGDADAASEEVDFYDLDATDPVSVKRFQQLKAEQFRAVKSLIEFVQAEGPRILCRLDPSNVETRD